MSTPQELEIVYGLAPSTKKVMEGWSVGGGVRKGIRDVFDSEFKGVFHGIFEG